MRCQRCAGEQFVKAGRDRSGRQIYQCAIRARRQTERSTSAFCGYRFPDAIIALTVRWYRRFRLPYADIVELLAERGVHVDAWTPRRYSTGCGTSPRSTTPADRCLNLALSTTKRHRYTSVARVCLLPGSRRRSPERDVDAREGRRPPR